MKKLFSALIIVFFGATMGLAQNMVITSASDPWAPFVDPDHPKMGISIEIVSAAFQTQGYELKHTIMPWVRAEDSVTKGKVDILPNTWKTDKRKNTLMYSEAYAFNEIKMIKKKGDPFEFNGLDSLTGKKVGIVRGYGYSDDFMNSTKFTRDIANEFILNIKKLVNNRLDLTLEDVIVARNIISQKAPDLLEQIEFTQNSMSSKGLHVTCGLKNPKHEVIISAFNKGLAEIKSNGTLEKILKSYGIN